MAEFAHHPEASRHFIRRLEAFGDIVYGFSLSQIAFALAVPARPEDVFGHPEPLVAASLTFLAICLSWLTYHRMYATLFVGEAIDVAVNFGLLATVALLPYAMRVFLQFRNDTAGFTAYATDFTANSVLALVLIVRGYRRFGASLDPKTRVLAWRRLLRTAFLALCFAISIPLVHRYGPQGTSVLLTLFLMPVARLIRTAPVVGSSGPSDGTIPTQAGS